VKRFESFLASELEEFVAYRENLGFSKQQIRSHLMIFDNYLVEQKTAPCMLTPMYFLEMSANLQMEPKSVNRVLYAASVFFKYLVRKDLYASNPVKDVPRLKKRVYIPFIFSPEQIEQLLDVVLKRIRKDEKKFLKDYAEYLSIALMAKCGMRISETCRLLKRHYRRDDKTLYIKETKFKKDRLIPIPNKLARKIENYLAARSALVQEDQNPYLLAAWKQSALSDNRVRLVFHQCVKKIGLHQPGRVVGDTIFSRPNPHSMRHSFAVNTLNDAKARGISRQNALPVLTIYMGHSEYKHTTKYLKMADACQRKRLAEFVVSQHDKKP